MKHEKYIKIVIIILSLLLIIASIFTFVFFKEKQKQELAYQQRLELAYKQRLEQEQSLKQEKTSNSLYKLNIVSSYGDNEAYHPKVLSFKERWNGYKYWMSYTPYPKGDDSKENPHIAVSNDLINWTTLANLDEPIETRPQLRYNSDSHIVYNDLLDRLECYWRYVDDVKDKSIIYRRITYDGITWTEKEEVIINSPRSKVDCVSPAIIFENGIYKMWYVDKNNTVKYAISIDGINWTKSKILKINYEDKVKTWHLDVIKTDNKYEMIVVAYENWNKHNDMNLYYTSSKDGTNWETAKVIMQPTKNTSNWDNKGLYRSSFIYEDGMYYVYYSGTSINYNHGIGFMYGKDIFALKNNNINYKDTEQVNKLKQKIEDFKINR